MGLGFARPAQNMKDASRAADGHWENSYSGKLGGHFVTTDDAIAMSRAWR
jgi:hypothetical protein